MKDTILYQKLGISPYLSDEQLRREGKKLLLKHHPDKNENKEESSKNFIEIKEILDILCDPKQRINYHQIGIDILNKNSNSPRNTHINSNDFFNEMMIFIDLFTNMTKIMRNMNKMNSYEKNFDKNIDYIVKVDLNIVDPYIPVVLNIVYTRYNDTIHSEENKKVRLFNLFIL